MDFRELLTTSALAIRNATGAFTHTLISTATANRTLTLPNQTGTIALTSDIKNVPAGGTTGQVLSKIDATDNNVGWSTVASGSSAIGKNYLHNSNFAINQLALTGTVTLAANSKDAHDRFKAGASGCTYTFVYTLGKTTLTITAGTLIQVVNGLDLASGTQMYCLSWGGTSTGKIGTGIAGASGVTGSVVGGTNLNITFSTGTLWEVKLEKSSTPSAYEAPDYADNLATCLLYFEVIRSFGMSTIGVMTAKSATTAKGLINYTRKIALPVVTQIAGVSLGAYDYTDTYISSVFLTSYGAGYTSADLFLNGGTLQTSGVYFLRSYFAPNAGFLIDARL